MGGIRLLAVFCFLEGGDLQREVDCVGLANKGEKEYVCDLKL